MAWHRPGDKSLSRPMMVILWRIYVLLNLNELKWPEDAFYQVGLFTIAYWKELSFQEAPKLRIGD